MKTIRLTVRNPSGIHLRPGAAFVRAAAAYRGTAVRVTNVTAGSATADARSMLSVTALKIKRGNEIELTADGPDEDAALDTLRAAVESGLGESLA
jgi:phosphotransferase system HPr (HPr) family protein